MKMLALTETFLSDDWPAEIEILLASENSNDKTLSKIGAVAEEFAVSLRTLRFYEDKNLLRPLRKGKSRFYTAQDRARLRMILFAKKLGFSLIEAKRFIAIADTSKSETERMSATLELLRDQQEIINEHLFQARQSSKLIAASIAYLEKRSTG